MLTLGSLFDGIGGWLLAAQHAGIKPLWRCEIDEYPRAVSEYHFPDTDSYGDIRKIHGNEIVPVDIICAGSPCQNLSMAGNRKGLQGNESSLFYESIRILKEMRDATNGKYPRFFVWENVVGAFSSNHGNDFRAVLSEIGQTKIPMPQSGRWGGAEWSEFRSVTSHGGSLTLSIGEFPSAAVESSLSQILQNSTDVPQKCYLSSRACQGILRRAARRGRALPPSLKIALERQAGVSRET